MTQNNNMTYLEVKKLNPIEQVACSRCCGSGQYSWCSAHGTTCFKCGGSGITHTKRGWVVVDYLNDLRLKEVTIYELKVGDRCRLDNVTFTIAEISEVKPFSDKGKQVYITTKGGQFCQAIELSNGYCNLKAFTGIDDIKSWTQAIDFQNTLNKSGKPTKHTSESDLAWFNKKYPNK